MADLRSLRPVAPILIGASVMLSLAMGLRQSLGLFMQPAVQDLGIAVSQFTLAVAVQNLAWGFLQPFAGAIAGRYGFRPVLVVGVLSYLAGLVLLGLAQSALEVTLGAGVLIGLALACTASGMALSVASRPVPAAMRSTVLGIVSAAGSLGALIAAPIGQYLSAGYGWRIGVAGFFLLGLAMLPAAWSAGRVDKVALPPARDDATTAGAAFGLAMRHGPFLVMSGAYFICGLQLVFLTTHLPSYLQLCGMDPMLAAQALAAIGGFNVLGSLFFGWAGGRWSKPALLGGIYLTRSLVLAWYFAVPPTPGSTLVFASIMGFLWLGVAPLVGGMTAEMFGLRWQAMVQGLAFTSHQVGSFLGAFGGGLIFDRLGSYDLAWQLGVGMGVVAGTIQMLAALPRRPGAPRPAPA
ncbi:MFS transporter [Belnapia rosea]|uniref:Predicted arabinose efflux permease, MFS family n=1 Tax=Belnapia rosea TaxID=938405 RepID=A0A1G6PPS1_9PROT|nr:MFS transporter [Belnapia rosea]SDB56724.1 Predicted arabinose efflux permease, MFS family [Belnapia rosea]SDC82220.1 Predicted arabinose efflux permease, MFS family [Belnapia rosea]